jgi:hypothetical protein
VLAFTNQVGNHPAILSDLEVFHPECRQLAAAQTARN